MLCAWGFERIGVVASDMYFIDPRPAPGQEGPEQGVRLEVRLFERSDLRGSRYSAQPIAIDRPIWRADLLESVDNPGSLDRAHHHPRFRGWEPGRRHYVEAMSADPVAWVGLRLADMPGLLEEAGVDPLEVTAPGDIEAVHDAVPAIIDGVHTLLDGVRAGRLGQPPAGAPAGSLVGARVSWL